MRAGITGASPPRSRGIELGGRRARVPGWEWGIGVSPGLEGLIPGLKGVIAAGNGVSGVIRGLDGVIRGLQWGYLGYPGSEWGSGVIPALEWGYLGSAMGLFGVIPVPGLCNGVIPAPGLWNEGPSPAPGQGVTPGIWDPIPQGFGITPRAVQIRNSPLPLPPSHPSSVSWGSIPAFPCEPRGAGRDSILPVPTFLRAKDSTVTLAPLARGNFSTISR